MCVNLPFPPPVFVCFRKTFFSNVYDDDDDGEKIEALSNGFSRFWAPEKPGRGGATNETEKCPINIRKVSPNQFGRDRLAKRN